MAQHDGLQIDYRAVGAGCLALGGAACVSALILAVLATAAGVSVARLTPYNMPTTVRSTGLVLRLILPVVVGYVTARRARHGKMAHALVLGALMMVLGVGGFIYPSPSMAPGFSSVMAWLLTIPLALYGGKLATRRSEPEE